MYRGDQKILERERDIEQVYYPNEGHPGGPAIINVQQRQPQGPGHNPTVTSTLVGGGGGQQYQPQQQQPSYPVREIVNEGDPRVGTVGRGDYRNNRGGPGVGTISRGNSFRSNRSECRSCSICSSSSRSGDYYYDKGKRGRMAGRSFPIAALLVGLLICISFINFVGIWSPFWALARNPFLIYPVTSSTTVNTGVPGAGGSGFNNGGIGGGGLGDVPLLLNPQTVQPPGGRIGIGNPIFGHLGIWAYCAPRSFCVTYPYGQSRPYGFFSAASFSLALAGLGGFFTQLFGGPLLGNLIGGLGFGGGLGGALGPGFSGLGAFGSGANIFKRSVPSETDFSAADAPYSASALKVYLMKERRSRRALLNSPNPPKTAGAVSDNDEFRFGIDRGFYQPIAGAATGQRSIRPGDTGIAGNRPEPPKELHPFGYYYDPASPNGINSKYMEILDDVKHGRRPLVEPAPRSAPAAASPQILANANGGHSDNRSFRQVISPPGGSFGPAEMDPSGSNVPNRNNRNLALGGFGGPALGGMGLGGIGALGLGSFGNRFGGMNGLLGSQQALVAFALLQPGPEGLPLPENFLFALPGSISPFAYFRNRIRENRVWFLGVQILVGLGFALNLLGLICAVVYLCAYHTKAGQILGRVVGVFLLLAAFLELIGICLFIAKMRLDRNAFFYIDPAFTIHSGVGWAFYVSLSGALLLLVVSFMLLWEANSGYHV